MPNLTEMVKLGMTHFNKKFTFYGETDNEKIKRQSDAEYFFIEGVKWATRCLNSIKLDPQV